VCTNGAILKATTLDLASSGTKTQTEEEEKPPVADVAGDNEFLFALKCMKRDNPVFSLGALIQCWIDGDVSNEPRKTRFYAIVRTYGAWDLQNGCTLNEDKSKSWYKSNFNHRCNDPNIAGNEPPEIVTHARDMWSKFAPKRTVAFNKYLQDIVVFFKSLTKRI
jgi:hypothetical protein